MKPVTYTMVVMGPDPTVVHCIRSRLYEPKNRKSYICLKRFEHVATVEFNHFPSSEELFVISKLNETSDYPAFDWNRN
jgi:hypothetical protein